MNINPLVSWGENILSYKRKNDFSGIKATYAITDNVIEKFRFISKKNKDLLRELKGKHYNDEKDLLSSVERKLGVKSTKSIKNKLLKNADITSERFYQYFSWIDSYSGTIKSQAKIMSIVGVATEQVKNEGIHNKSAKEFKEKTRKIKSRNKSVNSFRDDVIEYLKMEGKGIKKSKALLGTSDIIESIFGKYKILDSNSTMKGIGKMILAIPVFTTKITLAGIKKALECVKQCDLDDWIRVYLGKSISAKRHAAFKK